MSGRRARAQRMAPARGPARDPVRTYVCFSCGQLVQESDLIVMAGGEIDGRQVCERCARELMQLLGFVEDF